MPLALTGLPATPDATSRAFCWSEGLQVRLLLRAPNVLSRRLERLGAQVHVVELFTPQSCLPALSGVAALFRLAATNTTSQVGADVVERSTVTLTEPVLAAAEMAGVSTMVYTSSVVVLGRSTQRARRRNEMDTTSTAESPYVRGKAAAETRGAGGRAERADRVSFPGHRTG